MPDGYLTIGAAAKASGLTAKAVRTYEARGLLPPVPRTPAGYRLYDQADLAVLGFIRQARALGLNLDEIRSVLEIRRAGAGPCGTVQALLDTKISQIDQTIADLTALRATLTATRANRGEAEDAAICAIIDQRSANG